MEGSGSRSVQIMTDPDPEGPKTSGSTTLIFPDELIVVKNVIMLMLKALIV
jgi:hypothetical protein